MGCKNCKCLKTSKFEKEITLDDIEKIIIIQKIFRKYLIKIKIREILRKKISAINPENNDINIISILTYDQLLSRVSKNILKYISKKLSVEVEKLKFEDFNEFYLNFFSFTKKDSKKSNSKLKSNSNSDFNCNSANGFLIDPILIKMERNTKEIYCGHIGISLRKNGFGINLTSEGDLYIGNFKNGKFQGKGIYLFNSVMKNIFLLNKRNNLDYVNFKNKMFNDLIFTLYEEESLHTLNSKDIIIYKGIFNYDIPDASGKLIIQDIDIENSSIRLLFNLNKNVKTSTRRLSIDKGKIVDDVYD
jgi:hypothetical protein